MPHNVRSGRRFLRAATDRTPMTGTMTRPGRWRGHPGGTPLPARSRMTQSAGALRRVIGAVWIWPMLLTAVIGWAFFGWEFRPGGFAYLASDPPTAAGLAVGFLSRWHALPEPYLREVLVFADIMKPRPAYLFGEFRTGGFWDYFPVAFLTKSTVAMLLALGAWLFVRLPARPEAERLSLEISPVFAGALGYAAVAMLTPLNIGVRHILPLFLVTAVAGGVALARAARMGWASRAFAGSVALLAAAEGFSARRQPLAW